MILLINTIGLKSNEIKRIVWLLPRGLFQRIQKIFCISNRSNKGREKRIYNKPILNFPENNASIQIIKNQIKDLEVLVIRSNARGIILEVLNNLDNYKIFIDGYDKNNYQFIEDKELFVEIGLELNRISNKNNFSKIDNSSLLNYKLERREFYNPNELKRILSNNKKKSIIQFEDYFKAPIPKMNILGNIKHNFLRSDQGKFIKKTIDIGKRKIEILKGIEYLNPDEQILLIKSILKKASSVLNYRIIINGALPNNLNPSNFSFYKYPFKFNNEKNYEKENLSEYFYDTLYRILKTKNMLDKIEDFSSYLADDPYKNLIDHLKNPKTIRASLHKVFLNQSKFKLEQVKLNDTYFWYVLLRSIKTNKNKKSGAYIKKQAEVPEKPKKQKPVVKPLKIVNKRRDNNNRPVPKSGKTILEFLKIDKKWAIILNGDPLGHKPYSLKGIHLIKELTEKHNRFSKPIDAEKLEKILYDNLTTVKTFREKKLITEAEKNKNLIIEPSNPKTPTEAALNRLRGNLQTLYAKHNFPKLDFLWNLFEFSEDGCSYIPNKDYSIRFSTAI